MKDNEIEKYVMEQSERIGIDVPYVTYRKMKRFFGVAHLEKWTINLNKTWVHKAHEAVVKSTILHELLHLKNFWVHGSRAHDKQFREYCKVYRCHGNSCFTKKDRNETIKKFKQE